VAASSNLFLHTAPFYDLDCLNHNVREDLPLFRQLAAQQKGPVLELGCGTGRVTLDLISRGHEVWGVDASEPMLRQLRQNLERMPVEARARLHVEQQDMRSFDLGRRFALILIPYRSFQALPTLEEARQCLQCVRRHLDSDGLFVFDILRESAVVQSLPRNRDLPDWLEDLPNGQRIERSNRIIGLDRVRRIFSLEHIYRLVTPGEPVQEFVDRLDLRMYAEDEIGALLLSAKLRVRQTLLDYEGRNLGGAEDYVFVCER